MIGGILYDREWTLMNGNARQPMRLSFSFTFMNVHSRLNLNNLSTSPSFR